LAKHFSIILQSVIPTDEGEARFSFLDIFEGVIVKGFIRNVRKISHQNRTLRSDITLFQKGKEVGLEKMSVVVFRTGNKGIVIFFRDVESFWGDIGEVDFFEGVRILEEN
jgi:hypothetical protein